MAARSWYRLKAIRMQINFNFKIGNEKKKRFLKHYCYIEYTVMMVS